MKTRGGDIRIRSATDFISARTMGGDIEIERLDGGVRATTMGGDVEIRMVGDVSKKKRDVEIISKGGEWFAGIGHDQSTGTAILCLTGSLKYTGMIEVPLGINLKDVLYEAAGGVPGGKALKLVQTGGPLGGVLGVDNVDVLLDFEILRAAGAILGSGGIIAADEDTCVVDLTRALIAFCEYESCGKCFPCRMGMGHLLEVLERICRLEGAPEDQALMREVGKHMQAGSLCGHGQLGFNPVASALRYFGEEFETHIVERRCPTGTCQSPRFSPVLSRR